MRERIRSDSGQSLLEFALTLPVLFLLVVNVVNFGALLYSYITVANAARTGASYMIMGPSSANGPTLPLVATVQAVVNADLASLSYATLATVNVCSNNNGSAESPETCTSAFTDPQPATSVLGTVQVQYTFCPFIDGWNFPALGVYSTLPSCTFTKTGGNVTGVSGGTPINQVAVMRVLQ
jgi:Flp pilus assembly protein TadG